MNPQAPCSHDHIVNDGDGWGRCTDCGDNSFTISEEAASTGATESASPEKPRLIELLDDLQLAMDHLDREDGEREYAMELRWKVENGLAALHLQESEG